jgi:hypothetical protein
MKTLYKTKTGIEIGRAYQSPMPRPDADGELIQSALLGIRGPDGVYLTLYKIFLVVLSFLLAAYLWSAL